MHQITSLASPWLQMQALPSVRTCRDGAGPASDYGAPDGSCSPVDDVHVLTRVFALLDPLDLISCSAVCREWRRRAACPSLWGRLSLAGRQDAGVRLRQALAQRRFTHLEDVDLTFAPYIADSDLALLSGLRRLVLDGCQQVTDAGIRSVAERNPGLQHLSLYWNLNVNDAAVLAVAQHCHHLVHLSLSGCKRVTDATLESLGCGSCSSTLRFLDITRCVLLSDAGVGALVRRCCGLQTLVLYAMAQLGSTTYSAIASNLKGLRRLDVCGNARLSDAEMVAIANACPLLETLNLTWCVQVTDTAVARVATNCPRLRSLSLFGLLGVTTVEGLAARCGDLRELDVSCCANLEGYRDRARLKSMFPLVNNWHLHS